jgi:serine kinase of HPr protein (carbohydrate metabolism regulator)
MTLIHATCVEWEDKGILIIGDSGAGKSDLAIRLMEKDAFLISDDQTKLLKRKNEILGQTAPNIEGKIELRGVGIIDVDYKKETAIKLILELVKSRKEVPRMPKLEFSDFFGIKVAKFRLYPFDDSTLIKIKYMLKNLKS